MATVADVAECVLARRSLSVPKASSAVACMLRALPMRPLESHNFDASPFELRLAVEDAPLDALLELSGKGVWKSEAELSRSD